MISNSNGTLQEGFVIVKGNTTLLYLHDACFSPGQRKFEKAPRTDTTANAIFTLERAQKILASLPDQKQYQGLRILPYRSHWEVGDPIDNI